MSAVSADVQFMTLVWPARATEMRTRRVGAVGAPQIVRLTSPPMESRSLATRNSALSGFVSRLSLLR
jgi:hypothetical protein